MTPLHLAAYKGHYDIVTFLYDQYNANIVCKDNVSCSRLDYIYYNCAQLMISTYRLVILHCMMPAEMALQI